MNRFSIFSLLSVLFTLMSLFSCKQRKQTSAEYFLEYPNHIQLQAEDNFRDLGGFVGKDGRRVRHRKLFRSGELSSLTDSDRDSLINLGIEQIFDLRTHFEIEENPTAVIPEINYYRFPLMTTPGGIDIDNDSLSPRAQMDKFMENILSGKIDANDYMLDIYTIDSTKIANWRLLFDQLETGKTSVWHCTSGKDRTGMTSVLVLSALGVALDSCIADYMKSNHYLSESVDENIKQINEQMGNDMGEQLRPLLTVNEAWINAFIEDINSNYGGMSEFLMVLGVDVQKMQKDFLVKYNGQ